MNGGRPVVVLKGKNMVEEHDEPVVITYSFASSRMLVEPLILISAFFIFFLISSIVARMDAPDPISIALAASKKEKEN